jgi:hypothetical protein
MVKAVEIDRKICVAQIAGHEGLYGYDPSMAVGIVFCVLFGMSMLLHIFTSFRYRVWWQMVFAVGALSTESFFIFFCVATSLMANYLQRRSSAGQAEHGLPDARTKSHHS